jgi:hypothetical protein
MRINRELFQRIHDVAGFTVVRAVTAAGAISVAVAACSSGAASTSASPAATSAAPASSPASASASGSTSASAGAAASSHGSPQDVETGLIKAELADDWNTACSYLVPTSQAACFQAALQDQLPAFTGDAAVSGATVSGSQALVAVTGTMCSKATGCVTNSVSSTGMPNAQLSFSQAYGQVLSNTGNMSLSPVPCVEENGLWYINASL